MAFVSTQVSVTSATPIKLAENTNLPGGHTKSAWLDNLTASAIVYLGNDANVVASGPTGAQYIGKRLDPAKRTEVVIDLYGGEKLYAISAGATQTIDVAVQG